jgi:phosphoribosyl-ATP pyrophosphohydrolase
MPPLRQTGGSGIMALSQNQISGLSDDHLLAKIAEEASEVIKAAMKHVAHGARPFFRDVQYDNALDTQTEFSQLEALMVEHRTRWRAA